MGVEPTRPTRYKGVAVAAGVAAILIGGGHVLAWVSGGAAGITANTIVMKTNVGLGVFLYGLALLLSVGDHPSLVHRRLAVACATFGLLLGAASLGEHVFGWNLGIDQLIATEPAGAAATTSPNRMGPPAALFFVFLGAALLLMNRERRPAGRRALHEPLALVVALLSLLSIIGYLYGASGLYRVGRLTAVAWPTAVSFLVLAVGVLCARADAGVMATITADDAGGSIARVLLGPMVLVPLVFGWFRLEGERTGWFDAAMGTAVMMLIFIATFSSLVLFAARRVSQSSGALRGSEEKFAKAFRGNTSAMAISRLRDGVFIDVNDRYLEATGLARHQILGRSSIGLNIWKRPEDRNAFVRDLLQSGAVQERECHFVRPRGTEWTGLVSSQVSELEGEQVIISSIIDVTERRRAEMALRDANAKLAEADQRKDEFIAILSHELRNPLAPIRYALPLLQSQTLDDTGARAVSVINRQVDHLARLVDDLLDVSRITRGKIELRREHVTLASILTAATEAASPATIAARHRLTISVPDEPIWLYADPARVAQVVTNLLNNSAKYTPRGGEIALEAEVDCTAPGTAVIRVRDNGMGIPPDALPTVFDMFTQVEASRRAGGQAEPGKSQGGLGIGLSLAKRLVEMHGGTIEAHSAGVGHGAEFVVRLPIAGEATVREPEPTATVAASGRRLRVLVVDDNADLVEMLALVVGDAGHEVRTALDGGSAVSAALSFRPHLVLLDLGLPGMSGIDVAKELRRHPETAGVRLVALTGWGQAEDRGQTREAGFDDHLTKPTDPRQLERLLNDMSGN